MTTVLHSRREFLKISGYALVTSALARTLYIPSALGQQVSLASLQQSLKPIDGEILVPQSKGFKEMGIAFNKRTLVTPSVRVMCKSPEGVSICIQWAKHHGVELAMRCGGHSYEGLSETRGLAIDTRLMNSVKVSTQGEEALIGGGAALGMIYETLAKRGHALPAGTCPTVGVTGHTTGGGYGLLARPFGMACDSLVSAQVALADGRIVVASERENADLFWALRGAGNGSFGVITQMRFKTHRVPKVTTFGTSWSVSAAQAIPLIQAWQQWAPEAPSGITSLLKIQRDSATLFTLRLIGQTINSATQLEQELQKLVRLRKPTSYSTRARVFMDAVRLWAGKAPGYPSVFMKGKSDFVKQALDQNALTQLLTHLPMGVAVICDAYGGAIRAKQDDETAFPHRSQTLYSIQYYRQWERSEDTAANLKLMRTYYDRLRPFMSGSAYVNYCDLDLVDYANAYWGSNLNRLIEVKRAYDPTNLFRHAQSVPLVRS